VQLLLLVGRLSDWLMCMGKSCKEGAGGGRDVRRARWFVVQLLENKSGARKKAQNARAFDQVGSTRHPTGLAKLSIALAPSSSSALMSSNGTKRSRSSTKDTKRRSRSVGKKSGKDKSSRRGGKSSVKDAKKRRNHPKKDGKSSKSSGDKKSMKRAKHSDSDAGSEKEKKVSARNIEVPWHKRDLSIRRQPFRRLVVYYANEVTEKAKKDNIRLSGEVPIQIQTAVEGEIVEILKQAAMMAMRANHITVQGSDVTLTSSFMKPITDDDAEALYAKVMAKREKAKEGEEGSAAPASAGPSDEKAAKPAKKAKKAPAAADDSGASAASAPADGDAKKKVAGKRGKKPKDQVPAAAGGPLTGHSQHANHHDMHPNMVAAHA
jgi:histone H3/H4